MRGFFFACWSICSTFFTFIAALSESAEPCAFVTVVLSEDFVSCSAELVRSIQATDTKHDVAVLVLPQISKEGRSQLLEAGATHVAEIEEIINPNKVVQYKIFSKNYAIIRAWQLSELVGKTYSKAVYMDSDMVMVSNSDDLCEKTEFSAARDLGGKPLPEDGEDAAGHVSEFNAGLMILKPSEATFQRLLELAPEIESPSGGVQPLLRAAFPEWTPLDHLRDNVNARVFELNRRLWKLGRIRSIHYTGPVKPCFTDPSDSKNDPWDAPFRVWHRLRARKGSEKIEVAEETSVSSSWLQATDAWKKWFPVRQDSRGLEESDLQLLGAFHVCKHGSATFEALAQRIFSAGYSQLQNCQVQCSDANDVGLEIARGVKQMQQTLNLHLQRSSNDAQLDIAGLGSAEAILAEYADLVVSEVEASLRMLQEEQLSYGSKALVFDVAVGAAKRLRRLKDQLQWKLSYTLLAILWMQVMQLRAGGSDPGLVPISFSMELPDLSFQKNCCRASDVFASLLQSTSKEGRSEPVVGLLGGESASGEMEAMLQVLIPKVSLLVARSHGEQLALVDSRPDLVLIACSSSEQDPELEYERIRVALNHWWNVGARIAGCGFTVSRPGVIEAVSQHAIKVRSSVAVSVDATWWLTHRSD